MSFDIPHFQIKKLVAYQNDLTNRIPIIPYHDE